MEPIDRRTFILAAVAVSAPICSNGDTTNSQSLDRGILVKANQDRHKNRSTVLGGFPIDIKVSTKDTAGGLFVIENLNDKRGGPPRHLHFEQEEWFCAIEGEYLLEIANEQFDLYPGDSILAPRRVPHSWAFKGQGRGKLLIAFQPAGQMESFFMEMAKIDGVPEQGELKRLFHEHGMEITGPPLLKAEK